MIDDFIRSILGTWGNIALDFYIQNDIWINALVLLYGTSVFLARMSYRRSALFLLNWSQKKHGKNGSLKSRSNLVQMIEKGEIPWDSTKKTFWFPLITPPNRFVLYIKNQQTLQKLFNTETLESILHPSREKQNK